MVLHPCHGNLKAVAIPFELRVDVKFIGPLICFRCAQSQDAENAPQKSIIYEELQSTKLFARTSLGPEDVAGRPLGKQQHPLPPPTLDTPIATGSNDPNVAIAGPLLRAIPNEAELTPTPRPPPTEPLLLPPFGPPGLPPPLDLLGLIAGVGRAALGGSGKGLLASYDARSINNASDIKEATTQHPTPALPPTTLDTSRRKTLAR